MSIKLFVGNLPFSAGDADLEQMFRPYGDIMSVKVVTDRDTGRSRGFGFVEFSDRAQGEKAIKELNGQELNKRAITVNEAKPAERRGGGGGGGGGWGDRGGGGGGGGRGGRGGGGGGRGWSQS